MSRYTGVWASLVLAAVASLANAQTLEIYAGGNFFRDAPATSVQVTPQGLAVGPDGFLYITDYSGRLLRFDPIQHTVTALPGIAGQANFDVGQPYGLAFDPAGQLFVSTGSGLYRVDAGVGAMPYVGELGSGGPMVFGPDGTLYYASPDDNRVRARLASGEVTILAGQGDAGFDGDGGPAALAHLNYPKAIARDAAGNLYIADTQNSRVRRIDAETGVISTFAGTGTWGYNGDNHAALETNIGYPTALALDSAGNLYIGAEARILRLDVTSGLITAVAGSGGYASSGNGGPALAAQIGPTDSLTVDAAGNIYLVDGYSVRKVTASTGIIDAAVGNGEYVYCGEGVPARTACLSQSFGIDVDSAQNVRFTQEAMNRIRQVSASDGLITTLATMLRSNDSGRGLEHDAAGNLYVTSFATNRVYRIDAVTHAVTTFAGNGSYSFGGDGGPATAAGLAAPSDVAFDAAGNAYIADTANCRIRRVDAATGIITTYAGKCTYGGGATGDGGPATAASLNNPSIIEFDPAGNLVISDGLNCRLRRIDAATGIITTIAGNGTCTGGPEGNGGLATAARIGAYTAFAFDPMGNILLAYSSQLRRIDAATGVIDSIPTPPGGLRTPEGARIQSPTVMEFDDQGHLYLGDYLEFVIFRISGLPYQRPDTTGPAIEPHISGTAGTNGWYKSDVALTWSVTDAESSVSSREGCDATTITEDTSGTTFRCVATSAGGTSEQSVTIKRDATPPVLTFGTPSPVPNANGWNRTNVKIPFTQSDALSGVASTSTTSPLVLSTEGAGVTGTVVVTDAAGNSATFTSVERNIDKTPPVVTFASPADGATYGFYQDVRADYSCAGVSLVSCKAPTPNGELINTRVAGLRTFRVTGKDLVGFTTAVTHTFTVESQFNFVGFLAPASPAPTLNLVPRGAVVPVRWQLPDGHGGFVSNPASFVSATVGSLSCAGAPTVPLTDAVPGPAGLSFDATTRTFTYNWATSATWSNCRKLTIKLRDGTLHELRFKFQ